MRKVMVTLLFAMFAVVGLAPQNIVAKGQNKPAAAKEGRWDGHIIRLDKDASWMDVRDSKGIEKRIHWTSSTSWTRLNKPATDQSIFKEGERVICLGTYGDKSEFTATRIDLRVHP